MKPKGTGEWRRRIKPAFICVAIVIVLIVFLFPIAWLIITSFKGQLDVWTIWPFQPTLTNYEDVFGIGQPWYLGVPFTTFFLNSAVVCLAATAIGLIIGTFAAYSLARFNVGGHRFLFWILSLRMLPGISIVIPIYLMYQRAGLLDTHLGLFFIYLFTTLPLNIWLMRSFFLDLPVEIEEAAKLDGCSTPGVLLRVAIPLALPGMAVAAVFSMIFTWNEFLFAFVLSLTKAETLPVMVAKFAEVTDKLVWGQVMSVGTLVTLPLLAFAFLAEKYLVRGLTFGVVKG